VTRFTWDLVKNARTLRERGFGFGQAIQIFAGSTLERVDTRRDYGERRMVAIGLVQGVTLTVCYTDRGTSPEFMERRIISVRRSTRHERQEYQETFQGG
jgi:uncharacterized DUF497 family protein